MKYSRSICLLLFSFCCISIVSAQSLKTVTGTYEYVYDENTEILAHAKEKAINMAKVKALELEFGTIISNQTQQVESQMGDNFSDEFYSMSLNEVKGEWVETISENAEVKVIDGDYFIVAIVKGKARAITTAKVEIEALTLKNGTEKKFASTDFKDGDDLFLYFCSPINGNVCVYLEDKLAKRVYSLLPYRDDSESLYEIKRNKEYIFFSPSKESRNPSIVDEYTMTCENDVEYNTLHVVFSPNKFYKAKSSITTGTEASELSLKDFQNWLYKNRSHDKEMLDYSINITIRK